MRGRQTWWRWALVIAVLAGALYGRARLRARAAAGLGRIECALHAPDRFFQQWLADNLPCHVGNPYIRQRDGARFVFGITPAAALLLPAEARAGADTGPVRTRMIGVHWIPAGARRRTRS